MNSKSSPNQSSLPPLSDRAKEVLRTVQEDAMRMLAEGQIDTGRYGAPDDRRDLTKVKGKLKENEQNVKNKAWELKYTAMNEQCVSISVFAVS